MKKCNVKIWFEFRANLFGSKSQNNSASELINRFFVSESWIDPGYFKEIAIDYVRERYDEVEIHVEDLHALENSYNIFLASKDREYHLEVGSHNGRILKYELVCLENV